MRDGVALNLREVSVWYLSKLLAGGIEAWQWAKTAGTEGYEGLSHGAAFHSLRRLLNRSWPQSSQCRDLGSLAIPARARIFAAC